MVTQGRDPARNLAAVRQDFIDALESAHRVLLHARRALAEAERQIAKTRHGAAPVVEDPGDSLDLDPSPPP